MTTFPAPQIRRFRRLAWTLLAVVLLGVGTASIASYFSRSRATPPAPPEVDLALEPAVVEVVTGARSRVLENPHSAEAWGTLGEVFLANEMAEQSKPCFVQAERLAPDDPRWPYYQAGVRLNDGDREEALPFLQRALERCDIQNDAAVRLRLGETLLILGRFEEAQGHFRQVLARQPDDPHAHFDQGLLAISRQDWKTARAQLLQCIGSPFTRQKARVQLALVCRQLGDAASAGEFQQQAARLPKDLDWVDPLSTEYLRWAVKKRNRYRLAEQLETAGRFGEAAAVLRPLAEQYPDDYLPHYSLGKVLGQTGDYARAEKALRHALRLAPDKIQAHYYLGLILYMQADKLVQQKDADPARARRLFQEAAAFARRALVLKPDYGFAHMCLGLSLKRLGQRDEAVAALRQAVRCNPEYAELHFYLGEALAEAGSSSEARSRLEFALRLAQPKDPWAPVAREKLRSLPIAPPPRKKTQ